MHCVYKAAASNSPHYRPASNGINYNPNQIGTVTFQPQAFANSPPQPCCVPMTFPMAYPNMQFQNRSPTLYQPFKTVDTSNLTQQQPILPVPHQQQYSGCVPAMRQIESEKKHKYMVIFDWDDTIFPTTAAIRKREKLTAAQTDDFGKAAYDVLTKAMRLFSEQNIFIVTNGHKGWVEKSVQLFMRMQLSLKGGDSWSRVQEIITKLKDRIFSARHHEKLYPYQSVIWKTLVFGQIAAQHFGLNSVNGNRNSGYSIISIGDSNDEFEASFHTKKWLQTTFGLRSIQLVRIKLQRAPSRQMMIKQFNMLCGLYININGKDWQSSFDLILPAFIHPESTLNRQHYKGITGTNW